MKISVEKRETKLKSALKKIRHLDQIPAVLYKKGAEGEAVSLKKNEFVSFLRSIKKGTLATSTLEIELEGQVFTALVKGIEYHPVTEEILHIDFQPIAKGERIEVNVPVLTTNPEECVGVKMGGSVKFVKRKVKVRCLPEDLPREFLIDISNLNLDQVVRLEDVVVSPKVELRVAKRDILVALSK